MLEMLYGSLGGIAAGSFLSWVTFLVARRAFLSQIRAEADELVQEARDRAELEDLERREREQEIEADLWTKSESELLKLEEKIEELTEDIENRKKKYDDLTSAEKSRLTLLEMGLKEKEMAAEKRRAILEKRLNEKRQLQEQFAALLSNRLGLTKEQMIKDLIQKYEDETREWGEKFAQSFEQHCRENSEDIAKHLLDVAINRFARAACPERGIGGVEFPDAKSREFFTTHLQENIQALAETCGCDVHISPDSELIGVAGYDPVRRELTRRVLERLLKEKKPVTPELIRKVVEKEKQSLFRQIREDGDALARELKLKGLHPEIRQMMGSLRYRYSFTQNQYFHCGEVGWLCGLLASELGLDVPKARRSGMLHDIGKSMDHALEGGHAMIGADFIQARGEDPEVVHNVRSHHFDEQPSTDTAFLVIAADAVSGARPGARRSTIESYNQKVNELQEIANSFEGVTDCFVLYGGRELRVLVNGRKVDDRKALETAKGISKKIEEEMTYPGQIKVVVVREVHVTESTMGR
ncbi:MAG: HDIG domain-containing protein [Bdellovibrionaceae bacterium]|nr:HDIG domain-containing protein [Pseudobdellovibrionaceae bacterium]